MGELRSIRPEEMIQIHRLYALCFGGKLDPAWEADPLASMSEWSQGYENVLAVFDERERVGSAMSVIPYSMSMDGKVVGMSGIGGVVSRTEYRRQGNIKRLFDRAFQVMRDRGDTWSYLYPFSHPFYAKFGYAQCVTMDEYELEIEQLRGFAYDGHWEAVDEQNLLAARAVYDVFVKRNNFLVVRSDERFQELYPGKKPYTDLVFPYLYKDAAGQPAALMRMRREEGKDGERARVRVLDLCWLDPAALRAVLGFLYHSAAQYGKAVLQVPHALNLAALFEEPYRHKRVSLNDGMGRIVSVERALCDMRKPGGEGCVCIRVGDTKIAQNDGVFRVEWRGDESHVERIEGRADLAVAVNQLAQLVSGFAGLSDVALRGDVEVLGNRDALEALFVSKPGLVYDHF